jgi:hypothetical protein
LVDPVSVARDFLGTVRDWARDRFGAAERRAAARREYASQLTDASAEAMAISDKVGRGFMNAKYREEAIRSAQKVVGAAAQLGDAELVRKARTFRGSIDTPLASSTPEARQRAQRALDSVLNRIAELARKE